MICYFEDNRSLKLSSTIIRNQFVNRESIGYFSKGPDHIDDDRIA